MKTLAVVTRNKYIESIHQGYICVVNADGEVIYHQGDYKTRIFFRSSAKPLQVIPFVHSGAARELGFTKKEISLACASHSGEKVHQKTTLEMLKKVNLDERALHCGVREPYNSEERNYLISQGIKPSPLHAGCSGKHAAMLALANYWKQDISSYEKKGHPVQKEVLKVISEFTDEGEESIPVGTDGCGLPIYMLPIHKMALSYARFVAFAQKPKSKYYETCNTIIDSMTEYPEMVAGKGEFDTELMQAMGDKLIAKIGAEAVYCIGIKKGNLGICVKIADGNERAVYPVVMQLLLELKLMEKDEYEKLKHWHKTPLLNNREEHIGYITPIFHLNNETHIGDSL